MISGLVFPTLSWPGFPTQLLKETVRDELKKLLNSLLKELKELMNLTPDAVCMYRECTTHKQQGSSLLRLSHNNKS